MCTLSCLLRPLNIFWILILCILHFYGQKWVRFLFFQVLWTVEMLTVIYKLINHINMHLVLFCLNSNYMLQSSFAEFSLFFFRFRRLQFFTGEYFSKCRCYVSRFDKCFVSRSRDILLSELVNIVFSFCQVSSSFAKEAGDKMPCDGKSSCKCTF